MHMFVIWLIHTLDVTHSYVQYDAFVCATWLVVWWYASLRGRREILSIFRSSNVTHTYVWCDSFVRGAWLIRTCDMTYSYTRYDSFAWMTRLVLSWHIILWGRRESLSHATCDHMWSRDLFICVTWLIHIRNMTHLYVGHDSPTCATWLVVYVRFHWFI